MTEQNNTHARIFKVGTTTIVEDETLAGRGLDEIREILQRSYPEVAHATIRERDDPDSGYHIVEFLPRVGTKG